MTKTANEIAARVKAAYAEVSAAHREAVEAGLHVEVQCVDHQTVNMRARSPVYSVEVMQPVGA